MPEHANAKTHIDVCIATYKRPKGLLALLESLSGQRLDGLSMRVIVVDNDGEGSARHAVEAFSKTSPFPLTYDIEPIQGISYTRNRALSHVRAGTFAFLDDDETVDEKWLESLLETLERFNADAVFGRVKSILPPDAPDWAKSHPYFNHRSGITGEPMDSGHTSNVLVRTRTLGSPPQSFDPGFALTGGGDTEFFSRLHRSGKKFIWCKEAVAYEHVPRERLAVSWVCRRAFRTGQGIFRIFVRRYPLYKKCSWLLYKLFQLPAGLLALPFVRVFSYSAYVRLLTRFFGGSGQVLALLGKAFYYEEYAASRVCVEHGDLIGKP
jgi:succinoglycan biosynthesis protein ExoM